MTAPPRLLLFIPAYHCAPQIGRVLGQLTPDLAARFAEVMVVDNQSRDGTAEAALAAAGPTVMVVRNQANYGLGGSHKVAFQRCLDGGFDGVVVLHGDDQGRLADLMAVLDQHRGRDCVLGARFMAGSRLLGYSALRIAANRAFNLMFSLAAGRRLWDLGSGLNYYSADFLRPGWWLRAPNDLTFNYYMILASAARRADLAFVPISWREEDQVSNARLFRQGLKMLRLLAIFVCRPGHFAGRDFSGHEGGYGWVRLPARRA